MFDCLIRQDDVVVGTLTVRENLMFSANLRLPKTKTTEQKRRRVEKTILELGLTRCADTKVNNSAECFTVSTLFY